MIYPKKGFRPKNSKYSNTIICCKFTPSLSSAIWPATSFKFEICFSFVILNELSSSLVVCLNNPLWGERAPRAYSPTQDPQVTQNQVDWRGPRVWALDRLKAHHKPRPSQDWAKDWGPDQVTPIQKRKSGLSKHKRPEACRIYGLHSRGRPEARRIYDLPSHRRLGTCRIYTRTRPHTGL